MKIIGLTGGIATGKSTVAEMFRNANIPLIDTDVIAKEVLNKGSVGYLEVVDYFTEDILHTDKEINRKKLGRIIFTNSKKLKKLNSIVHPKVKDFVLTEIEKNRQMNKELVIIDVPLLYESGFDSLVDEVIVVYVDQELQVQRLMDREQITKEYAMMKIKAQLPLEEKVKKATYVIDNSSSILDTKKQFTKILAEIEVE
jgi:dephospho-CoA kinase